MQRQLVLVLAVILGTSATRAATAEDERVVPETRREVNLETRQIQEALATMAGIVKAMNEPGRRTDDAPQRLEEAVRTGRTDAETFATIASWVLHAKEEDVAKGVATALKSADIHGRGRDGERWNATTHALIDVIVGALGEAQRFHRRGGEALSPEMVRLLETGRPAVAAALAEADPAALDTLVFAARTLGGAPMGDLVEGALEALKAEARD